MKILSTALILVSLTATLQVSAGVLETPAGGFGVKTEPAAPKPSPRPRSGFASTAAGSPNI